MTVVTGIPLYSDPGVICVIAVTAQEFDEPAFSRSLGAILDAQRLQHLIGELEMCIRDRNPGSDLVLCSRLDRSYFPIGFRSHLNPEEAFLFPSLVQRKFWICSTLSPFFSSSVRIPKVTFPARLFPVSMTPLLKPVVPEV